MFQRSSGILMHISSLPNEYGIGDMGKSAYEFIDFLKYSNQKLWQILPLGPVGFGNSPYQSFSSFAGNYLLIDMEELVDKKLLETDDLLELKGFDTQKVDFENLGKIKTKLLLKSYQKLLENNFLSEEIEVFYKKNRDWLEEYSLYMSLKEKFQNKPWQKWKKDYKNRRFKNWIITEEDKKIQNFYIFVQFIFYSQWYKLKEYANKNGIKIVGDIPIYVATDSADTWGNSEIFKFTKSKVPKKVAGCPPDYFSKDGQLWGNVVYDWKELEKRNFSWWISRIEHCFKVYDILRIDHFRGFESFWSVDFGRKTARKGKWEKGPGIKLFQVIEKKLGKLPIIAEDLGVMTPKVKKMLEKSGFPGMKILEFAFDSVDSEYLPHKYCENSVAYTGTHDNDTILGWYENSPQWVKERCVDYLRNYLGSQGEINWDFIEGIWKSRANIVITQMQDLLGLDSSGRMNIPSTVGDNWIWRMKQEDNGEIIKRLKELNIKYNR